MKCSRVVLSLVLLSLVLVCGASAQEEDLDTGIQILRPGTFHGDEVSATSGEKWFALAYTDEGYRLKETTLSITLEHDPIMDSEDEKTGKRVSCDLDVEPRDIVLFVKGLKGATDRPVRTEYCGDLIVLPGQQIQLGPPDEGFDPRAVLTASGEYVARRGEPTYVPAHGKGYSLRLMRPNAQEGKREQVLFDAPGDEWPFEGRENGPRVQWVGDLDGDGIYDYLIDMHTHYNVSEPTLFLSTYAQDGEVVGVVAVFRTVGC